MTFTTLYTTKEKCVFMVYYEWQQRAAARDKLTVQVVEKGSSSSSSINNNLKPTNNNYNIQPASSNNISFGNPTPIPNISELSNLNWIEYHYNQRHHEPYFKFLQSPINKSSSSITINNFQTTTNHHHHRHHHQPDLQLSLSTPKPVLEQVAQWITMDYYCYKY